MGRLTFLLICFTTLAPAVLFGQNVWSVDIQTDPLTDEAIAIARLDSNEPSSEASILVRCQGSDFEVYVDFGDFLDNDLVDIRYRINKDPLVEEKWLPSADGSAVFAASAADFARQLLIGGTAVVEASDYRGQPHRAIFQLANADSAVAAILNSCGISPVGLDKTIPGLRREVAIELERWGPQMTSVYKRLLSSLGRYDGPEDPTLDPAFAIAVQEMYDGYIADCRDGKSGGDNCESLRIFWDAGMIPIMPPISAVLYEKTRGKLRDEAGRLRVGD